MRIRYFIKDALRFEALAVIFGLIYSYALSHDGDSVSSVIYMVGFGSFMVLACTTNFYTMNLPLALSFGSTRKEAAIGMQAGRLTALLLHLAAIMIIILLFSGQSALLTWKLIPFTVGLHLCMGAVGVLVALLYIKWGQIAMIIGICLPVGIGTVLIFSIPDGFLDMTTLPWVVLLLGAVLYGLIMILEQNYIKKYNVKL